VSATIAQNEAANRHLLEAGVEAGLKQQRVPAEALVEVVERAAARGCRCAAMPSPRLGPAPAPWLCGSCCVMRWSMPEPRTTRSSTWTPTSGPVAEETLPGIPSATRSAGSWNVGNEHGGVRHVELGVARRKRLPLEHRPPRHGQVDHLGREPSVEPDQSRPLPVLGQRQQCVRVRRVVLAGRARWSSGRRSGQVVDMAVGVVAGNSPGQARWSSRAHASAKTAS